MKTISELTDIYYKQLYPKLQELETQRKKIKKRFLTLSVVFVLFMGLVILWFMSQQTISYDFLAFLIVGLIAGISFLYQWLTKEYKSDFKNNIMYPLIHAIDENLTYNPTQHIPHSYVRNSQLIQGKIDKISGNDYVYGKIDGVHLQFSDICVQQKKKSSRNATKYTTLFEGLFIVSEFPKKFSSSTVILPDTAQNLFGQTLGHWLQSNNLQQSSLIKMDNPEFEKEFVVYGSDQIEARYILTPAFMEKLLALKKRAQHDIMVSFRNNTIYLAIAYNEDLFEPAVFHSLFKYKIAMQYIQTLHLSVGIIEELQLNQKLWSKR